MVKGTDFWEYLCEDLNYRLFAGVPCKGLKPLYDKMDSNIMHYIPAAREDVALGVVSGASIGGHKGAVLLSINSIYLLYDWLFSFNIQYEVPLLIIAYDDNNKRSKIKSEYKIPQKILTDNFKKDLTYITNKAEKSTAMLIITEGVLK